jgi:orotate phosphoribosyltransferase
MNLANEINKVAKLTGKFLLRSGQTSDTYFDKYMFEADPKLLKEIASKMKNLIPEGTEVLAGLEMGGIPIATVLSQITGLPTSFIRKDAKKYGTCKYAEGSELLNKKVVIIEDVVTSGGAIIDAVEKMRKDGIIVNMAICVIDRESKGKQILKENGIELVSLLTKTELDNAVGF